MITVYYKGQMLSLLLLRCCRSSQLVTSLLFLEAAAPGHDRTVMRKTRGKGVARWSDLRWSSMDSNSSDIYLVTVSTDPVTIITRWFIWELPRRLCPVSQDNIPYNSPADCLLILDISTVKANWEPIWFPPPPARSWRRSSRTRWWVADLEIRSTRTRWSP